jgi:hypothetical protein
VARRSERRTHRPIWPCHIRLGLAARPFLKGTHFGITSLDVMGPSRTRSQRNLVLVPKALRCGGLCGGPPRAGELACALRSRGPEQKTLRREFTSACRSSARWARRFARAGRWDRSRLAEFRCARRWAGRGIDFRPRSWLADSVIGRASATYPDRLRRHAILTS